MLNDDDDNNDNDDDNDKIPDCIKLIGMSTLGLH